MNHGLLLKSIHKFTTVKQYYVVEPNANRKIYTIPKQHQSNLTAAKFEAWKMWQENCLSAEKANFPGRSAPIKETTVLGYLLDAALVGYELDWPRLCKELRLTHEIFANIEAAILKVGSKEKLKPIKDELPEEVNYAHIKACLTMQDLGLLFQFSRSIRIFIGIVVMLNNARSWAFANIEAAILKVGSKEKLKPIKDELPEEVNYAHIKACLTMQDLGMSAEELLSNQ